MKKFLLFAGADHYANGGAFDFISSHETIEECFFVWDYIKFWDYIENDENELLYEYQWSHILDTSTGEIIMIHDGGYCGQRR